MKLAVVLGLLAVASAAHARSKARARAKGGAGLLGAPLDAGFADDSGEDEEPQTVPTPIPAPPAPNVADAVANLNAEVATNDPMADPPPTVNSNADLSDAAP